MTEAAGHDCLDGVADSVQDTGNRALRQDRFNPSGPCRRNLRTDPQQQGRLPSSVDDLPGSVVTAFHVALFVRATLHPVG